LARRFRFTTRERLNRFVLRHAGEAIAARATDHLRRNFPVFSAGPRPPHKLSVLPALAGLAAIARVWTAPTVALQALGATLAVLFLSWLGLRLAAAFVPAPPPQPINMSDDSLPVYGVIAALYPRSTDCCARSNGSIIPVLWRKRHKLCADPSPHIAYRKGPRRTAPGGKVQAQAWKHGGRKIAMHHQERGRIINSPI